MLVWKRADCARVGRSEPPSPMLDMAAQGRSARTSPARSSAGDRSIVSLQLLESTRALDRHRPTVRRRTDCQRRTLHRSLRTDRPCAVRPPVPIALDP